MVNPIKFGQKMLGLTPSWSENVRINTELVRKC